MNRLLERVANQRACRTLVPLTAAYPAFGQKDNFTPLPGTGYAHHSEFLLPRTRFNYAAEVGIGLGSSVLMSPIKWIQRTWPEAVLEVLRGVGDKQEVLPDHPVARLLSRPNPHYSYSALLSGLLLSYIVDGNAYLLKMRGPVGRRNDPWYSNVTGEVRELWYAPHWTIEPRWPIGGIEFISHYEYRVSGQTFQVDPQNVVHIRCGIDPRNTRRGLSLIESEMREIFTDDEAANMTAALCKNMGIPGIVISPDMSAGGVPVKIDVDATKAYFRDMFTGDKRGEPAVMSGPTKLQQFGFSPAQLQMGNIRDIAEERVCSALGLPAAVVGFGTGLQQTKVGATMIELKKLAWEGCLIPMQTAFAQQFAGSLLPDFEPKPELFTVRYNQKNVAALADDMNAKVTALNVGVQGGWIAVSRAQAALGMDPDPTQDVYLRSLQTIEAPASAKSYRGGGLKSFGRKARMNPKQRALMARMDRDALVLSREAEPIWLKFFEKMGRQIADVYIELAGPKSAADDILVDQLLRGIEKFNFQKLMTEINGEHYVRVTKRTIEGINALLGLAVDLPDDVARRVIEEGGKRMGLVDLNAQMRDRLFREIADAREQGEGPIDIARRLRESVPAGPWSSPEIRAAVIARSETLHAQRLSTLTAYREAANVDEVMVFDNRTGYGDEDCEERDGQIMSFEEAEAAMADTHPNCTMSFAPVVN